MTNDMSENILLSLDFLTKLIRFRVAEYLEPGKTEPPPLPKLEDDGTPFTRFIQERQLTADAFIALITALAPHVKPQLIDEVVQEFFPQGSDFPPIGGVKGTNYRGLLPTGETVLFLLAQHDLHRRAEAQQLFGTSHFFSKERILYLEEMKPGEPASSGRLVLDPEHVELFTLGYAPTPRLSTNFPAQLISTEMDWDDLVLPPQTLVQLAELENWLNHNDTLMEDSGIRRRVKPGYRILFYGPPGGGKTLTASLLGKSSNRLVFKVDLSMVVSKYIGETEKNLAALFDKAQHKNWILFFDEADALFSKRTGVRDAHDKYANQEASFLLQRIEDHPGLIILASNFKSNMDEAFIRRFQSVIHFPMPRPEERLVLWRKSLPTAVQFSPKIQLEQIAEKYELSGSNITNIVHYCCLQALASETRQINPDDLLKGIQRELIKENKMI